MGRSRRAAFALQGACWRAWSAGGAKLTPTHRCDPNRFRLRPICAGPVPSTRPFRGHDLFAEKRASRSGGVGLLSLRTARVPGGKWSGQRWTMSMTRSTSPGVSLTTTSPTLLFLEIRQRAAAIRFGHAMLCGPIGPDAIESDSVRIGGGALCRAQGCLGTEPRKSARGSVREEPALRRPLCVVDLAPFIGAFFSRFPQEHNKVLQFRRHFLRRLKALPVPSGIRLEFGGGISGNMRLSFQAARSIG
jgi:hypothetical protein